MRRTTLGIAAGFSVMGLLVTSVPASATTKNTSAKEAALKADLLSKQEAKRFGFPAVVRPAISGTQTGSAQCPLGAEVVYENHANITGLIDIIYSCPSNIAASNELQTLLKSHPASNTVVPPSKLGSTAVASTSSAPLFAYLWQRRSYVVVVAVDTDATTNRSQQYSNRLNPLTTKLHSSWNSAAIRQDAKLR